MGLTMKETDARPDPLPTRPFLCVTRKERFGSRRAKGQPRPKDGFGVESSHWQGTTVALKGVLLKAGRSRGWVHLS